MSTSSEAFKADLHRVLVLSQLTKYQWQAIQYDPYTKEQSANARKQGKKGFIDIREVAAVQIRAIDSMLLKIRSISPEAFTLVANELTSDFVHEINIELDKLLGIND